MRAALLVPLALLLPLAAAGAPEGVEEVAVEDNKFTPALLAVGMGDVVRWVNRGDNTHTVSAVDGSFHSGLLQPGMAFEHRFDLPGPVVYRCMLHSLQWAVVVVAA